MKRLFLKSAVIIIMSAILVSFSSCIPFGDGGIIVTGIVYEWVDAPHGETSRIYVKVCDTYEESRAAAENILANIPSDIVKVALEDAVVALGYKDEIENRGEECYDYKVITDPDGSFEESWTTAPAKDRLLVKVAKLGYIDVAREVEFTGATNYAIVAILVRRSSG